jgi:hypothetical protein
MLHLKGLEVYITIYAEPFSYEKPGLQMLCWGADSTTEKRRQAAALQGVRNSHGRGRIAVRTAGLEFAIPE